MLKPRRAPAPRFDRDAWLEAALEVLARQGESKLRVETLARGLGVTKGSFYHHFKNRQAFLQALLDYWAESTTHNVIAETGAVEGTAHMRLLHLMRRIEADGLDRYDCAFRSWAAQEPLVAKGVKKVDFARYRFVRSLFEQMGFAGDELEDRVKIWLVFHSTHHAVSVPGASAGVRKKARAKTSGPEPDPIARRHAFFTEPGKM